MACVRGLAAPAWLPTPAETTLHAGAHLLPEAGATEKRTLEAVRSSARLRQNLLLKGFLCFQQPLACTGALPHTPRSAYALATQVTRAPRLCAPWPADFGPCGRGSYSAAPTGGERVSDEEVHMELVWSSSLLQGGFEPLRQFAIECSLHKPDCKMLITRRQSLDPLEHCLPLLILS